MNFVDDQSAALKMQELLNYLYTSSDLVTRYIQEVSFQKNDIIVEPNDSSNFFYLVQSGVAFVEAWTESNEREVLYFLTSNQLYSPESLYDNFKGYLNLFPMQLRAASDLSAYKIDCDFMMDHLYAQPKHLNFLFLTALRELSSAQLIFHIHKFPTEERIDRMLQVIASAFGEQASESVLLPSAINQSVLASLCGLSQSAISIRLKKLVKEGILSSTHTPLQILKPNFLPH